MLAATRAVRLQPARRMTAQRRSAFSGGTAALRPPLPSAVRQKPAPAAPRASPVQAARAAGQHTRARAAAAAAKRARRGNDTLGAFMRAELRAGVKKALKARRKARRQVRSCAARVAAGRHTQM
jgi:hypothetical protein